MDDDKIEYTIQMVQKMTLMDDIFARQIFKNHECSQLLIRTILDNQDIQIQELTVQEDVGGSIYKSVILDILAKDNDGILYNIEIQRADKGAEPVRARYHSSMLDTHILAKGQKYGDLTQTYIIFITENDILKGDQMLYTIKRYVEQTNKQFADGSNIIYVNTGKTDDTALGKLIHDLKCVDPEQMYYEVLRQETKIGKNDRERMKKMSSIVDEIRADGIKVGEERGEEKKRLDVAKKMIKENLDIGLIEKITGLSKETIRSMML